jgi:hypothetical protein
MILCPLGQGTIELLEKVEAQVTGAIVIAIDQQKPKRRDDAAEVDFEREVAGLIMLVETICTD